MIATGAASISGTSYSGNVSSLLTEAGGSATVIHPSLNRLTVVPASPILINRIRVSFQIPLGGSGSVILDLRYAHVATRGELIVSTSKSLDQAATEWEFDLRPPDVAEPGCSPLSSAQDGVVIRNFTLDFSANGTVVTHIKAFCKASIFLHFVYPL